MPEQRRILVAIDDSSASARVSAFVNRFFEELDVTVTAINVGRTPLTSPYPVDAGAVYAWPYYAAAPSFVTDEDREAIVSEEAEDTIAASGVHATHRIVELGVDVADTIRRVAKELGVDLIVVGSSHKNLFERLLSPSVSSDLAKAAPTPVLVVH